MFRTLFAFFVSFRSREADVEVNTESLHVLEFGLVYSRNIGARKFTPSLPGHRIVTLHENFASIGIERISWRLCASFNGCDRRISDRIVINVG